MSSSARPSARPRGVEIDAAIQQTITELHPNTRRKVRAAIDAITQDPATGEPLEQELTGFRKIALGAWRIVYREDGRTVRIHAIGHRATVYSELIDRLRRSVRERARRYRRARSARVSRADDPRTRRAGSRDRGR